MGDVGGDVGRNVGVGVGANDCVPEAVLDWPLATATTIKISAANSAGEESVRGDMVARGGSAAARRRRGARGSGAP